MRNSVNFLQTQFRSTKSTNRARISQEFYTLNFKHLEPSSTSLRSTARSRSTRMIASPLQAATRDWDKFSWTRWILRKRFKKWPSHWKSWSRIDQTFLRMTHSRWSRKWTSTRSHSTCATPYHQALTWLQRTSANYHLPPWDLSKVQPRWNQWAPWDHLTNNTTPRAMFHRYVIMSRSAMMNQTMSIFFIFTAQMTFMTRKLLRPPPPTKYRFQFPQLLFHRFNQEPTPNGRENTTNLWLKPSWCNNKLMPERPPKTKRKKKNIIIPITPNPTTIIIRIIIAVKRKKLLLPLPPLLPPRNKSLSLSMSSSLTKTPNFNLLSFVHLKKWINFHHTIIMVLEALRLQVLPAPSNPLSFTEQWDGSERWVGSCELIRCLTTPSQFMAKTKPLIWPINLDYKVK